MDPGFARRGVEGGVACQLQRGRRQHIFWPNFLENCMRMKKPTCYKGAGRPWRPSWIRQWHSHGVSVFSIDARASTIKWVLHWCKAFTSTLTLGTNTSVQRQIRHRKLYIWHLQLKLSRIHFSLLSSISVKKPQVLLFYCSCPGSEEDSPWMKVQKRTK